MLDGGSSAPPQTATANQPLVTQPTPQPSYADFYRDYLARAAAQEKARGNGNFYSWISGTGRDAALADAKVTAPAAYYKSMTAQPEFTSADTAAKSGQLALLQRLAQTGLVSGQDIDPNNIPAALGPYLKAMRAQFPDLTPDGAPNAGGATPTPNGEPPQAANAPTPPSAGVTAPPLNLAQQQQQQQQPVAPSAPATGAPQPSLASPPALDVPPQQQQPAPINPELVKQRALFDRLARFQTLFGNPTDATKFYDLARQGIPGGSTVLNGSTVEGVTGTPLNMTGQDYTAQGEGKTALAKEVPHVAGQQAIDNNQTRNQRGTDTLRIGQEYGAKIGETNNEKEQTPITGYSTETGQPMVAPASALKTGLPGFSPGTNPYIEKHSKEQEAASKDAQDAATGIIQAQQLVEAAQNIVTGAWGDDIQDIRRGLSTLGVASPKLMTAAKKGDVVNELGTELAALRARAATGGRVPMSTFQIFRSVKPGLLSTDPSAVAAPIIASFQRQLDFAEFQNKYYSDPKNWNKLDAVDAFRAANPDQKYIEAARVPEPVPPKAELKNGTVYKLPGGQTGKWNGQGFEVQ